jgi:hypothetical protein
MMKFSYFFLIIVLVFASCAGNKKLAKVDIKNQDAKISDSVEYELIIFDPGFESWYVSYSKPTWYHSQTYYETWNKQYVIAWNAKAINPRFGRYFESTIEYDPFTDYGLELNHRLFYYFQYVEKVLKIYILSPGTGPQTVF